MARMKNNETLLPLETVLTLGPWQVTVGDIAGLARVAELDATRQGRILLAQDGVKFRTPTTVDGKLAFANYRVQLLIERDPVTDGEVAECNRIVNETEADTLKRKAADKSAADELAKRKVAELREAEAKGREEAAAAANAQMESLPHLAALGQRLATVFAPAKTEQVN
jgi:hypothetical protein